MKIIVTITTYKRPDALKKMVRSLMRQMDGMDYEMVIMDDATPGADYQWINRLSANGHQITFIRTGYNYGKTHHWMLVDHLFRILEKRSFDYVLYVQDDLRIPDGFIGRCVEQFEAIRDESKVCLNYVLEESRVGGTCWTPAPARIETHGRFELYRVGWVELHFLSNRHFFETLEWHIKPVDPKRWDGKPHLSSGVGRQISKRLFARSRAMYQVTESLAGHGHMKSIMNERERNVNKLRSI